MKITKIFSGIALALGLIYAAIAGYLTYVQIEVLGSRLLPVDGGYSLEWTGIVPEAVPALGCLVCAVVGIVLLIWSFIRPSLALQILSVISTVASAVIFAVVDLNTEMSVLFWGKMSSLEGFFVVKTVIIAIALLSQVLTLTPSIYLISKKKR